MTEYTKNGKIYKTTQDPYLGMNGYQAHAIDSEEKEYMLHWDIIDDRKDWEDESERCNWDVFRVIPL